MVTDASHNEHLKMAGIAMCWAADGEPISADVVSAQNANIAEALGVLRALRIVREAGFKNVVIETDCALLTRTLDKPQPRGDQMFVAITGEIALMILNGKNWSVRYTPRNNVRAAHIMARQVLKAWVAGKKQQTTWSRVQQ